MLRLVGKALKRMSGRAPVLLSLSGLGVLVAAGFTVSLTWGLVALGLSLFALEWRLDDPGGDA